MFVKTNKLLAIDLGTTSLAARLITSNGVIQGEVQLPNPQSGYGSDVITRLERARNGEADALQRALIEGVEQLLEYLDLSSDSDDLRVAAAGNSSISHLLLQLPVDSILFPPHRPKDGMGRLLSPIETGLAFPLFLFPLISGYIGGDLVACLLGLDDPKPGTLLIDLGTNAEMALLTEHGWLATSVAAGPAFEGAGIKCGMRAEPGALKTAELDGERLLLKTVEGSPLRGICGSGLVSAVAAALDGGLLGSDGTLKSAAEIDTNLRRYLREGEGGRELQLYRDASTRIVLTQDDIRQFQLAKGAVLAGVRCLIESSGMGGDDVEEVILTGAFSHGISRAALTRVALLPQAMVDKVRFVSAGVLDGLQYFLLQEDGAGQLEALIKGIKPYPLSGTPVFEQAFLEALNF